MAKRRKWILAIAIVILLPTTGLFSLPYLYQAFFAPRAEDVFGGPLPAGAGRAWTFRRSFFGGDVEEYLAMELNQTDYEKMVLALDMGAPIGMPEIGRHAFERPSSWFFGSWWDCSPEPNEATYYRPIKGTGGGLLLKHENGKAFLIRSWY